MTITISVSNIGPIRSASVRLKPLTLFVGPNNTGKSVLATVVYAALQKRPGLSPAAVEIQLGRFYSRNRPGEAAPPDEDAAPPWLDYILSTPPDTARLDALSDDARRSLAGYLEDSFENYAGELADELERCFGATLQNLHRTSEPHAPFTVLVRCDQPSWSVKINLGPGPDRVATSVTPPDLVDVLPALLGSLSEESREQIVELPTRVGIPLVTAASAWHAFAGIPRKSWYLPAARSGLLQNYRAVAGALVRRRVDAESSTPSLPGIVTDFLGEVLDLDDMQAGDFSDAARELETRTLGGEIRLNFPLAMGPPEIRYRSRTHDFPLHRTSSMVSELAPVVLYLRHLVRRHDLLLVEEPEAHLHPESQTLFAQILGGLVNSHLPILLVTHSDYFLHQLNNLIVASRIDLDTAHDLGIPTGAVLSPDVVGAYGFTSVSPAEGTDVHELKVDRETGVVESSFLHVAESLYDQLVAIDRADTE